MAANDGERPRLLFQYCLAILRYTVATVVTVLAIVVILKVVAVGVRPEDIRLSVVHGHVGTSSLWREETTTLSASPTRVQRAGSSVCDGSSSSGINAVADDLPADCAEIGSYDRPPTTRTTYSPVTRLDLQFTLSVENPSGRGNVRCNNIHVSFIDGTTTIHEIGLPYDFQVRRQSSHKFYRTAYVRDATVLAHVASAYGGRTSFTGKLQVTMNTSDMRLGRPADPRNVSFECWPVEFSVADASDTATSVQCTPRSSS